jgi:hypothetical protein
MREGTVFEFKLRVAVDVATWPCRIRTTRAGTPLPMLSHVGSNPTRASNFFYTS